MSVYDFKIVQFFIDLKNLRHFRKEMKREDGRADSKFTRLNLKRNWFGNIVYTQLNCTDTDYMNADYNEQRMLDIKLKPYVEYLSGEMNWGDYLVPEISNFVDEENNKTLSYGVLFIFTGYTLTLTKLLFFYIFNIVLAGVGIWAAIHFLF